MATITDTEINFDEYSPELFVQMMTWLRNRMANTAPLTVHRGGYTLVFKTAEDKAQYLALIETQPETAEALVFDKWKEGGAARINVNILSGYSNKVLLGSTGNLLQFTWETVEDGAVSHEPITVNYTVERNGATETFQETYAAYDKDGNINKVSLNLDQYLDEGTNNITIQVTGNQSTVTHTETVTYVVSQLSLQSDFNIAELRSVGGNVDFGIIAKGSPDDGSDMIVEYCYDGVVQPSCEQKVSTTNLGKQLPQSLALAPTAGKHTLQMRAKTTIGGIVRYSNVLYFEFVTNGTQGRKIVISRVLNSTTFLGSSTSLTLFCKQYVVEEVEWAFYSSNSGDKVSVSWGLANASGESTTVANTTLGEDSAINDGTSRTLAFIPVESGTFTLNAVIGETTVESYDVSVEYNSSIQETMRSLILRLNATGRDNSEDLEVRKVWKYGDYQATLTSMDWNQRNGWYNNALNLLGGKMVVNCKPFVGLGVGTGSATVEIDFETFSASDDTAVVFSVGNNIKITANTAHLYSNSGNSHLVDKFPTNTRMKLAFVVHAKTGMTEEPKLMEIINGGISSRLVAYNDSESFYSQSTIVAGGTQGCGIKIYSLRVYTTELSTSEELNNTIIGSTDITKMVSNNDIYTGGKPDVNKIRNKVATFCLTGKGGSNVLKTIWDYTDENGRPVIYMDGEYTNPDYPSTNFKIENMRLRGHGQSTMRNPMKSLKIWFKDDADNTQYTTRFYPQGVEDDSEDHLWAMKPSSHPVNKFVLQCYYIDSSNSKSPAILSLYNEVAKAAGILTPPQLYARDTYPTAMSGATFPYEIRQSPDSLPCYLLSREDEHSEWKIEGIFVLMNDKKNDYLYGERTIYDAPGDPFCYRTKKSLWNTLWDNSNVTRIEFKSNNHPVAQMSDPSYIEQNFYGPPKAFVEEDAEPGESGDTESTESTTEGGDTTGENSSTSFDCEQAIEIIYPDYDDFYNKSGVFNTTKYQKHMTKYKNFAMWVAKCYSTEGVNSPTFRAEASQHMDLEKFAFYYVHFRAYGGFDSVVRNMQFVTMELKQGTTDAFNVWGGEKMFDMWFPMPWDWDIAFGTINTGPLAYDPPVDRQTTNSYGVAFRGQDNAMWNMLEAWPAWRNLVSNTFEKMYQNGFTYDGIVQRLLSYSSRWSETMYNESEATKYKKMYLSNPAKYADFLAYNLGRGMAFMQWWLKVNFDALGAEFAAGPFSASGINWRGNSDYDTSKTYHFKVSYDRETHFGFAIGNDKQVTSSGGFSLKVNADQVLNIAMSKSPSNSEYTTIYSAPYIKTLDISEFGSRLGNLNLGALVDATTGTMLEEFYFGCTDAEVAAGTRNGAASISIVGLGDLTSLRKLQAQGFRNYSSINISALSALTHLYCKGSGFTSLEMPESATMAVAELPSTISSLTLNKTTVASLTFYDPDTLASSTFPKSLQVARFVGLGTNAVVKQLVLDWLAYVDAQGTISQCSLTIYNVSWTGLTYEQILRIGKVGSLQITGYLQMGGDTPFTSAQMSAILAAYSNFGDNIFDEGAAFFIGCAANGFSIGVSGDGVWQDSTDGVWCVLAGKSCKLSAVSFSASGATSNVMWNILNGTKSGNSFVYNNASVNINTGALTTEENGIATYTMTLNVTDGSSSDSIRIRVVKRQYPTAVRIQAINNDGTDATLSNGKLQITNPGYYLFKVVFTVNGAEDRNFLAGTGMYGNFKPTAGHQWTYTDTDANRSAQCTLLSHHREHGTDEYLFCLHVYSVPTEDCEQNLSYWAQFKDNGAKVQSQPLPILMFSLAYIIGNYDDTFGGNQKLYTLLTSLTGDDGQKILTPLANGYITNQELKKILGTLTVPASSQIADFISTSLKDEVTYNVLTYLTNTSQLICTDCVSLLGDLDVTGMQVLQKLKLSGTSTHNVTGLTDKSYLNEVSYSRPTKIQISGCPQLLIN